MSKRADTRARRQRQSQFQTIFVVILAVVAVGVVAYLVYQGLQSGVGVTASGAYDPVKSVGPADAKVVVQEFADFQCPYCGKFATGAARQLVEQYAQAGKVRFEYHHFIVVDGNVGGTESLHSAVASECAGEQGKFWDFYSYLFAHQQGEGQGTFSDANLKSFAATLGLDTAKFDQCFDAQRYAQKVQQDNALAGSLGIRQTPTLLVNNKTISDPLNTDQITAAIEAALAAAK